MPVQYMIDADCGLVQTLFTGVVTSAEVAEQATRLGIELAFDAIFSELIEMDRIIGQALAMTFGVGIFAFDARRQREQNRLRPLQFVGKGFEADQRAHARQ